jgi:hypothetical protein
LWFSSGSFFLPVFCGLVSIAGLKSGFKP